MIQIKKPSGSTHRRPLNHEIQDNSSNFDIHHCQSKIIQENRKFNVDLNVEQSQTFQCFQCGNIFSEQTCIQCGGNGYLPNDHPLVQLMNELFNAKFATVSKNQTNKEMISTKTSSNSHTSDSLHRSQAADSSYKKNSALTGQNKSKQTHRSSILQFICPPLQSIIKQQSTHLDQKCRKCNICHYEFDNIKYTCQQCQNYNVCQQCYKTKRISHFHQLKKIQSLSSKKTSMNQDQQKQRLNGLKFNGMETQQYQNTHSDVGLSLKSNDSQSECMFDGAKTEAQECLQQGHRNQNKFARVRQPQSRLNSFFKLHVVEPDLESNNQNKQSLNFNQNYPNGKSCENCKHEIEDCYWICQTCQKQSLNYQICKDCYDNASYRHPQEHVLGLNFFTLSSSFFQAQNNFLDTIKQAQTTGNFVLRDAELRNGNPFSGILQKNDIKTSIRRSQPDFKTIGIVHRDIFPGFNKQVQNQQCPDLISPIPRSLGSLNSSRETNPNAIDQSDCMMIPQLMAYSVNSYIFKFKQRQRINTPKKKQPIMDQSRVQFDDNVMMNFSTSTDYNEMDINHDSRLLSPNEKKGSKLQHKPYTNILRNSNINLNNLRDSVSTIHKIAQINLQNSLMDIEPEDFIFVDHYCDICKENPIKNVKYHCLQCQDYDLCQQCYMKRKLQHWHDHFRKDDGQLKNKKTKINKERTLKRAMEDLNNPMSPMRKSVRFIK